MLGTYQVIIFTLKYENSYKKASFEPIKGNFVVLVNN